MDSFLLSITIPTFNRANFLKTNLQQLQAELKGIEDDIVEIIVSDNCSEDETQVVVQDAINQGLPIKYVRNSSNKGWGFNFFQCFDLAQGHYVYILSDDDFLYDGALKLIIKHLLNKEYGVLCLKAYGFEDDFKAEYPGIGGSEKEFTDFNKFFIATTPQITLLSASIFNKNLIKNLDTKAIEPGNFAHLHLILRSAAAAEKNLLIDRYLIAVKRNNSSNYIYSKVFVVELWALFEKYTRELGLHKSSIRIVENKMLFTYYPTVMLRLRLRKTEEYKIALADFSNRFKDNLIFRFWVAPILILPEFFALIWGSITILVGKLYNLEYKTVFLYFFTYIKNRISKF